MTTLTPYLPPVTLPGVESITAGGLRLRAGLSLEAYAATGAFLKASQAAAQLWLADWRQQGIGLLGREAADQVSEQLVLEIEVPEHLPPPERRCHQGLTPEHYFVAGHECESEEAAVTWLEAASSAGLTPAQLKASIRAGEIRAGATSPAGTRIGIPTIQRVAMEFNLFEKNVDIARYAAADCALALELLSPILSWAEKVKARLAKLEAAR